MKILLIGNYQLDAIQSMDIFASMLENYLTQLGHQVRIIRPNPWFGKLLSSPDSLRKWLGYIDKFVLFPAQLRQALSWADIVHICDQGNAVYVKYLENIPHVITCHDLFPIRSGLGEFPEYRTGWSGKQFQQMVMRGLNKGHKVACVSEQTKSDVLRLSFLSESAVSVIPMGLNYPYTPMTATESQARLEALEIPQNCEFVLHVGANHWYKNRLGVLSIFYQLILNQPEFYLVMVGKPMTDKMHHFIKMHNITQKVIELVEIDNENLRAIYSSATALVFPSLYEGFGWPIIEAQACGCPVFTSNRSPMNDVGGEAAIYIEPDKPKETAEDIIRNLPTLKMLKSKGFVNSQKFSPEKMISEYIKLYHQAIDDKYDRKVKTV
ncbi:mannosyltransferase [Nostoc sp. 'Peltigera membranacea cyanobiont' 213]|uniref:glycosyltransferase family 4 protein n=1 Tax=Nostoc sp. 'Peltigera membranacea cyanobiont' 213 TaxID=2014530 RepID=UPI000B958BA3|nr:glycosyltransferase family 1 protein [Nostoc sp. 'Peltigera membranacea cyanobiont' 213]OYD99147.1 mannosyltransferase [Nostoc sp. 'Peltigera membranacea cyanobiont' 213]